LGGEFAREYDDVALLHSKGERPKLPRTVETCPGFLIGRNGVGDFVKVLQLAGLRHGGELAEAQDRHAVFQGVILVLAVAARACNKHFGPAHRAPSL
jgi:hypothetical protein